MKDWYLVKIFRSHYCKIVFIISLILAYFLVPQSVFYSWYSLLGVLYMTVFALTLTCIVRNIKEKILLAKTYQSSIIGVLAAALGMAALQVCGIGAPVCGAAISAGLLSVIFPSVFLSFLNKYALLIVVGSIILQGIALYFMNCFRKCLSC
jgi:hypothetical protein